MTISQKTKLDVNSYTVGHFTHKGNVGYTYFKLFLEIELEKYKELGYIPNFKLTELIKLAELNITAQGCAQALSYFFKTEGLEDKTVLDALIYYTEEIIEYTKLDTVEEDEF